LTILKILSIFDMQARSRQRLLPPSVSCILSSDIRPLLSDIGRLLIGVAVHLYNCLFSLQRNFSPESWQVSVDPLSADSNKDTWLFYPFKRAERSDTI